ncbi:hypothetical protein FNF29_07974 [Cafeteria roenbergensis]|uniref:Phytase-like domain-containing protein n=1 Tax=Cafeteria roenbergensis TaxID=33653 RepID=A0A5A8C1R9_CAFRO|nr:hypothetical protein FNF29_07974 [Cafeteria roenbergensis]|eukprot:KAA0146567.1 hypothetical protein FNF29_07974 [Cafeteria roenbergensis]
MRTALVVLGLAAAAYAGLPPSGNQMCRRVAKHSLVGLASHGSAVGLPVEPTGHGGDRWVEGLAVASAPDGSLAVLESVGMWGVSGIVCHSLDVKDGTAPPSLAPRQWRMPMPSGGGQDPSAPGFAEGLTVVSAGAGQASARAFQLTYRKGVVHEYAVEPRKEGSPRGLPVGEQEAVQAAEQRRAAAEAAASSRVQAAEEAAEAAEAAAEADAAALPAAALGDLSGGPPVLVSSDGTGRLYLHSMEGTALPGGVKSLVLGRGAAAAAARCGCLASVGDAWLRPNELEAVKVSDAFGVESLSESSMVDEAAAPPANATPAASPSASAPSPTAAPTKQATSSPVPAPSVVAEPSAEPPASLLETKASLRRAQEDEEPDRAEQEDEEPDRAEQEDEEPDRAEQEDEEPDRAEQEDEEPDRAEQEDEEPDRAEQEGGEPDRAEQEDEDPAPTKAAADRSWRWEVWAALYASAEPCIVRVAVLPDSDAWPVVGVIGFDAASAAMAEAGLRASMSGSNLNGVAFASGGGPGKGWAIITGKMWRGMYAFRTSDGVAGGSAGSEE